ncbi:alpha/beta hydrolase [Flavobacterium zepuense]|uniref:Alpha/beta hydrolase n=1 Tax=Flavobacterium zepuense TaxID=2593302 RepID=A0A552V9W0_9FLAO|nr:alpha/beta hydrolase [Flavobacterium zepuense]TRW27258.1 alpha/beta hydrolase [Flavobacterium zepuense]
MKTIKNIVLVHGAFADGSGWRGVYNILSQKGYNVTIVHNPLTSLEDGVEAVKSALDRQDGPAVLVGHSYGGALITEAGNHTNVSALVYVAAFQPDNNESALTWIQTAPPAPENGVLQHNDKGVIYYDKDKFHAGLCADLSAEDAAFMYASQGAFYAKGFVTPIISAAWRTKPTYALIATDDKSIAPEIQEAMYKRSNTIATKVKGSHLVYISQPQAVADVIVTATSVSGN